MMFINARRRFVSNGFETFVPPQRVESLHQRLVEMTNNDVNAWDIPRPVGTYQNDSWNRQLEGYDGNNENFPLHQLYAGYFQGNINTIPQQVVNFTEATCTPVYQPQFQPQFQSFKRPSVLPLPHSCHNPGTEMGSFEKQSPMLGSEYTQYNLNRRNGSFTEFSSTKNAINGFSYASSTDTDPNSYTSALSQDTCYHEDATGIGVDSNIKKASPSTVYSGYSSSVPSVDPQSLVCENVPATQNASTKCIWWPEVSRDNKSQYQNNIIPALHHGLPTFGNQVQAQQFTGFWSSSNAPPDTWAPQTPRQEQQQQQPASPATISPKVLTLNMQPAPMSSSGSSQGSVLLSHMSSPSSGSGSGSVEEVFDYSVPETLDVVEPPPPIRKPRQVLPSSIPSSNRAVSLLPVNRFKEIPPKRSLRSSARPRSSKPKPQVNDTVRIEAGSSKPYEQVGSRPPASSTLDSAAVSADAQQPATKKPQSAEATMAMHHRDAKDDFLVRSKLAGMSYKDIRRAGNFTEAESTLRGRFRTLTKHKAARVRRPEWDDNDVWLLKKAVRKLAPNSDPSKGKVPWKQVAEYIANHGGSYHFGNATCRKRWDEIQARR